MADIKAIQSKIEPLKKLLSELETKIKDKRAKDYLLVRASHSLRDAEEFLLPNAQKAPNARSASMWAEIADFELRQAETRLDYAKKMVATYGPDLEAIG